MMKHKVLWGESLVDGKLYTAQEYHSCNDVLKVKCAVCQKILGVRINRKGQYYFFHQGDGLKMKHDFSQHQMIQQLLVEKLSAFGGEVKTEHIFNHHRADVVCVTGGQKLIIEVQRTPITIDAIMSRKQTYCGAGFRLIWVIPVEMMIRSVSIVKMRKWWQYLFCLNEEIIFYSVKQQAFFYIHQHHRVSMRKMLVQCQRFDVSQLCLNLSVKEQATFHYLQIFSTYYQEWCKQFNYRHSIDDLLSQKLYRHFHSLQLERMQLQPVFEDSYFNAHPFWVQVLIRILLFEKKNTRYIYCYLKKHQLLIFEDEVRITMEIEKIKNAQII